MSALPNAGDLARVFGARSVVVQPMSASGGALLAFASTPRAFDSKALRAVSAIADKLDALL